MTRLSEELRQRAALYRLLRGAYTYPLRRDTVEPLLGLEAATAGPDDGIPLLQRAVRDASDWPALVHALNVEYTRLFEGPGAAPAPPYASFHLNAGRLMGPETLAVRGAYLDSRVAHVRSGAIPDDHIAVELAFMELLSEDANAALRREDAPGCQRSLEAQASFVRAHLLPWVPRFCRCVADAAPGGFFEGLAKVTQAHLETDREWLEDTLSVLKNSGDAGLSVSARATPS